MIQVKKEITDWGDGTKNHTYFIHKEKLIAYQTDSGKFLEFEVPMKFSTTKRKFKNLGTINTLKEYHQG